MVVIWYLCNGKDENLWPLQGAHEVPAKIGLRRQMSSCRTVQVDAVMETVLGDQCWVIPMKVWARGELQVEYH